MKRTIKHIIKAQQVNMGGNLVYQSLPSEEVEMVDPVLLIHHWDSKLAGGKKQSEVGVPPHPHRGFSPITFIFKGGIRHQDSMGNDELIVDGGTQWMNAGKGVIHSERPSKDLAEEGGQLDFIQFWLNTPRAHKMDDPEYLSLTDEDTPSVNVHGGESVIKVVSGEVYGQTGPINPKSPFTSLRVYAKKGDELAFEIEEDYNALIYQLDGELQHGEDISVSRSMIVYENDGSSISIKALDNTRFIVLAGKPLNEPVASYGPFVLNDQREIIEALNDAQSGKMGKLAESFD